MHVGHDTTGGDRGSGHHLVEFIIVANRQLQVTGTNGLLLVLAASVAGKLQDLACEVLKDSSGENTRAKADTV